MLCSLLAFTVVGFALNEFLLNNISIIELSLFAAAAIMLLSIKSRGVKKKHELDNIIETASC